MVPKAVNYVCEFDWVRAGSVVVVYAFDSSDDTGWNLIGTYSLARVTPQWPAMS